MKKLLMVISLSCVSVVSSAFTEARFSGSEPSNAPAEGVKQQLIDISRILRPTGYRGLSFLKAAKSDERNTMISTNRYDRLPGSIAGTLPPMVFKSALFGDFDSIGAL
jgi:hypothetical protein